jgi:neutral ceramidase
VPTADLGGGSNQPSPDLGGQMVEPIPNLRAGAAKVDLAPPIGVPLAGYGNRRASSIDLDPGNLVTMFKPSTGQRDPVYARALVLDDGKQRIALVSLDTIGVIGDIVQRIVSEANKLGSTIKEEQLLIFGSHTHSGPGAVTELRFWQLAAVDLLVPQVRDALAQKAAQALVAAEKALEPATLGTGSQDLFGATKNRRVGTSPTDTEDSIDPGLGVVRVDRMNGEPLALVWNFAIHGTAFSGSNMQISADVMGAVSAYLEQKLSVPALFANGAEGDIKPVHGGEAGLAMLGPMIGDKALAVRSSIVPSGVVELDTSSAMIDFGDAEIRLDASATAGGDIDLKALSALFGWNPSATQKLGSDMVDHVFRIQAVRLNKTVIASVPGEAIHALGLEIKSAGKALGFDHTFVFGLANGHMSYVTNEVEFNAGGYESTASFFGPQAGAKLVQSCKDRMTAVKP